MRCKHINVLIANTDANKHLLTEDSILQDNGRQHKLRFSTSLVLQIDNSGAEGSAPGSKHPPVFNTFWVASGKF